MIITTESDEEEMGMIIGAVLDGGRVLVNGGFRLRSNGKMAVWRCAGCNDHGRTRAREMLDVIRAHRDHHATMPRSPSRQGGQA